MKEAEAYKEDAEEYEEADGGGVWGGWRYKEKEFDRKELEAWEAMKVENTMKGNGTTLSEMGAVLYIVIYIISSSNALFC